MPSTRSVCGEFVEPTFVDYGQCHPRRLKRNCRNHLPQVPGWGTLPNDGDCEDENISVEFHGDLTPPLRTISTLFDESCEAIQDPDGNDLTAPNI